MDLLKEVKKITPVEKVGDIYFKRDDKFAPFESAVNGSKAMRLVV